MFDSVLDKVVQTARVLWQRVVAEALKFGVVGGVAYLVQVGVYNALLFTVWRHSPVWAMGMATTVATFVTWMGSRYWTFRDRRSDRWVRELVLFLLVNAGGLVISSGAVFVSYHVLGFHSKLSSNIAGNVVGVGLGTIFRYVTYKFVVFRAPALVAQARTVAEGSATPAVPR